MDKRVFFTNKRLGMALIAPQLILVFTFFYWPAGEALYWAFTLERTTPTRVAISVTVNPIAASLVGAVLLGEPLRWNLIAGIVTVFVGIWIATTQPRVTRSEAAVAPDAR